MLKISQDVELLNIIGKGAYGDVYMGKNSKTKEIYAIKKITKKQLESETIYQYFNNEIFILKHLNHPNIIKFKSLIEYKTDFYLSTEYCNGGNLEQMMKYHLEMYKKPIPEKIVRYIIYNILLGIIYLNKNNLIHRDIKSDNILLHYEDEEDLITHNFLKAKIKIIDFGFARYLEKDELAGSLVGTPMYMEPSILKTFMTSTSRVVDGFYDKKVDVWSLGILTYELLIGIVPFIAKNIKGLFHSVEQRDFCIPKEDKRNLELSEAAINFIDKTLNIDVNMRPLAEELIKDPWILGNFDKKNLYRMKSDNEIAIVEKKTNFANFWKPIKIMNDNIAETPKNDMNIKLKKRLEIVGLSYIDPSKTNKLQNGKKFDYHKIKDLLNSKNRNTGKLLNNFKMKIKNKKRAYFSPNDKEQENNVLTEADTKTDRIINEYENHSKDIEEELGVPVLNSQNQKIKTICQIKISNLNKIDNDNNNINNTISSCRNNMPKKIQYHYFNNDTGNNKIYSNFTKNNLKRRNRIASNSLKTLDFNRNQNKIKIKYSYSSSNNNDNNFSRYNNNIINQNNVTNYINNVNNNIYINNINNSNNTSYINSELKIYKKKFSFKKNYHKVNFNNEEIAKKNTNKSQNIDNIDSNLKKLQIKKLKLLRIPKINGKLKDKLKQKRIMDMDQKSGMEIDSD